MPKGNRRPTPGRVRDKAKAEAAAKARRAKRKAALGNIETAQAQNTPPVRTGGRLARGNLGKRVAQPKKRQSGKVDFGSTKRPRKRSKT